MTMLAFLLSGQASQTVGMGAELMAACDDCRETLFAADRALGYAVTRLMVEGPEEALRQTAVTQPAILALSVAHARHLMRLGMVPDFLAGHSVGQYSAMVAAGALEYERAIMLVAERGRRMQETVPDGEGAMMAIVGLDREEIDAACKAARAVGVVSVALLNAPGQTVISGDRRGVAAAVEICEEQGGGAIPLLVSVPFHCELLAPMVPLFKMLLSTIPFVDPRIPVMDNVTALPLLRAEAARRSLVEQITSPVLFEESLDYMVSAGVDRFVECGPGKSLLGFAKRVAPGLVLESFDEAARRMAAEGWGSEHDSRQEGLPSSCRGARPPGHRPLAERAQ